MNIADRIHNLRKTKGISQEQLADEMGVSRQAVSKWESEQTVPDIDKVIALSEYFGVTTDYLLKGIEPTEAKKSINWSEKLSVIAPFLVIYCLCVCSSWGGSRFAEKVIYFRFLNLNHGCFYVNKCEDKEVL